MLNVLYQELFKILEVEKILQRVLIQISAELLGLGPELNDVIREIRGVGGTEFVYEKNIDNIEVTTKSVFSF